MIHFLSMLGLFVFIALAVAFTLTLATPEERPTAIIHTTMKNFNMLCLIILVICIIVSVINFL
ncbi:MAG: hypothetical protein QME51_05550 [Planctomycetota bacterium]|nr:hypothetical protein [Planctomycetota bacterium]